MIPDTNACLHFSINHKIKRLSGKPILVKLSNSDAMKYYLEAEIAKNTVKIIDKVYSETVVKIWDILSEKGGKANLHPNVTYRLVQESFKRFNYLHTGLILADDVSLLDDVKKMYNDIWNDPSLSSKRETWARIKRTKVSNGPPRGPDLKILATTSNLAKTNKTIFLTFDHDFIVFAEEIHKTFDVEIMNAGAIPN